MVLSKEALKPPIRSVLESYVNVTTATYTARGRDRQIGVYSVGSVTVTLPTGHLREPLKLADLEVAS